MATGTYKWNDSWTTIQNGVVLTQGGTTTDLSSEVDVDNHAEILLSVTAVYSNHAKATAGLSIYIRRDVDDTNYETVEGAAVAFEMPFEQNATQYKAISFSVANFDQFKVYACWGNTTASSAVTVTTRWKYANMDIS